MGNREYVSGKEVTEKWIIHGRGKWNFQMKFKKNEKLKEKKRPFKIEEFLYCKTENLIEN